MKPNVNTQDTKEILEMATDLKKQEMLLVQAFIAGLEAKDKIGEDQKAAG